MADFANEIQKTVKNFIVTNFYLDPALVSIDPDTSFLENGIIDSTGILEVIGSIEEKFNIQVEDAETMPENLDSLNNIANYIQRKKGIAI